MVNKQRWGRWALDSTPPVCLGIWATPYFRYEIELSTCHTLERQENWLRHMSEKRWVKPQDIKDLLRAFEDLGLAKYIPLIVATL